MYFNTFNTPIDSSLLSTLLSLSFKIENITQFVNNFDSFEKTDKMLIRTLLGALNSFQNFILFNCKLSLNYENKQFFGFSINESEENNIDIEVFLGDISILETESDTKKCHINQMILKNMTSDEIQWVTWKINNNEVNVKVVMDRIKCVNDFEVIFWYQHHMFSTIIKLLFTKIQDYLEKNGDSQKILQSTLLQYIVTH